MSGPTTPFFTILLLWGAGLGAAAQYAKVSVIFDDLAVIYAGGWAAALVSVVGLTGIVLGVVAGGLVARVGPRRALLAALWLGAALSAGQALLPPLPLMLGLRALEGVSHLALVVAAPTLIAQLSAARHRGLTLTLWSTFFSVAFTLLVWLGLPLAAWGGVGALFAAHGLWMAAFAVILGHRLPHDPAGPTGAPLTASTLVAEHGRIYRSPALGAPALGWLFYTLCYLALLTLLPPYLEPATRNAVLGAMPLVSIGVSMTLGVALLRRVPAVTVIMLGFGASTLALVWLLAAPGGAVPALVLAATLGLVQGATFAAVPELNPTAPDQARANGALAQMGNVGNTFGTPLLFAVIGAAGYPGLIGAAMLGMSAGLCTHLWLARRRTV